MKKALIYGLLVAMLLSLAACSKPQDTQQDTSQPDPAATSSQLDTVTPEPEPSVTPEPLADIQESEHPIDQSVLLAIFELSYNEVTESEGPQGDIEQELSLIVELTEGQQLPEDYVEQYQAWRPEVQEAAINFTEVNEQVWATGTVNLRSGPGTSYEKVGSLTKSQQATRTGIGQGEAEGWSRVVLNDGSEVCVSNTYLSTTKPAAQQQQASQQSTQQQTSKPSSSSSSSSGYNYNGYNSYEEMIEAIHKDNPDMSIERIKKMNPDPATGHEGPSTKADMEKGLIG